jgi:hypothetical protein
MPSKCFFAAATAADLDCLAGISGLLEALQVLIRIFPLRMRIYVFAIDSAELVGFVNSTFRAQPLLWLKKNQHLTKPWNKSAAFLQ